MVNLFIVAQPENDESKVEPRTVYVPMKLKLFAFFHNASKITQTKSKK